MSKIQPETIRDCTAIIKKCRRQITQATGMIEACRLIRVGESIDEVEATAYNYKRQYNARLNEVMTIRDNLSIIEDGNE